MSTMDKNDCGCCEGIETQTPAQIYNPPGLPAISYRVGTYAQFKQSMLAHLSDFNLPGLRQLKTRNDDDFSIALLNCWAVTADVLTFYQERIANESYKATATEPRSLLELAHLVNYKLQPGIAANTDLAFIMESAIGSPERTTVRIGTKVQSLPNPGEKPQIFETTEEIEARKAWSVLKPGLTQNQPFPSGTSDIIFSGPANLRAGDALLIVDQSSGSKFVRIKSVKSDTPKPQQTTVQLEPLATQTTPETIPPVARNPLFANWPFISSWPFFKNRPTPQSAQPQGSADTPTTLPATIEPGIYALRIRASLFGYNAIDWKAMHDDIRKHYPNPTDPDWTLDAQQNPKGELNKLELDRAYPQIIPGSLIVVEQPDKTPVVLQVKQAVETAVSKYALSAKITQLTIDPSTITIGPPTAPATMFSLYRKVTVYAQNEKLTLAEVPDTDPVKGTSVIIPGLSDGPSKGRVVIVLGKDSTGMQIGEPITLEASTSNVDGSTTLNFKNPGLLNTYQRDTVSIYGNVARATQCETVQDEIIGSGDATQPYQSFTLRQSPLTYIQASTPDGKASTLSITVNSIPWMEVDTFYRHSPRERIYVTRIEEDSTVTVTFGDGITGARLPTGEDNVHARYRKGTGLQGVVQPGQLSVLLTRPLGVRSVTNPSAPTGADDPETQEDARRNATNTIFTLGRIVSEQDYKEYALSYARVSKAQANKNRANEAWSVFVTIAGPATSDTLEEAKIEPGSPLYNKILSGMRRASDPTLPIILQTFSLIRFRLAARVKVNPNNPPDGVLQAVEQAVVSNFSFDARAFGRGVTLQEVTAVIKRVPGVVTAVIEKFYQYQPDKKPEAGQDNLKLLVIKAELTRRDALPDGTLSASFADLVIAAPHPFDYLEVIP